MKIICTICARGGSKGVKNKNIRPLLGQPLIAYSIQQAHQAGIFDVIAVSSDSSDILRVALEYGADIVVKRPAELATDTAPKIPVIQDCVVQVEQIKGYYFDVCVDLDATSPLRSIEDILESVNLLESASADNVITATPARRSPYFNMVELSSDGTPRLSKILISPVVRRQDSPLCFDMNASIYVWDRSALFRNKGLFSDKTKMHIMPENRSIDIDSEVDFLIVEALMKWKKS